MNSSQQRTAAHPDPPHTTPQTRQTTEGLCVMNATNKPSYPAARIAAAGPAAAAAAGRGALALQDRRKQRRMSFQRVARAGVPSAQVYGDAGCVRYTRAGLPSEKQAGGEEEHDKAVEEGEMTKEEGEKDEKDGLEALEGDLLSSSSPITTSSPSSPSSSSSFSHFSSASSTSSAAANDNDTGACTRPYSSSDRSTDRRRNEGAGERAGPVEGEKCWAALAAKTERLQIGMLVQAGEGAAEGGERGGRKIEREDGRGEERQLQQAVESAALSSSSSVLPSVSADKSVSEPGLHTRRHEEGSFAPVLQVIFSSSLSPPSDSPRFILHNTIGWSCLGSPSLPSSLPPSFPPLPLPSSRASSACPSIWPPAVESASTSTKGSARLASGVPSCTSR